MKKKQNTQPHTKDNNIYRRIRKKEPSRGKKTQMQTEGNEINENKLHSPSSTYHAYFGPGPLLIHCLYRWEDTRKCNCEFFPHKTMLNIRTRTLLCIYTYSLGLKHTAKHSKQAKYTCTFGRLQTAACFPFHCRLYFLLHSLRGIKQPAPF